jgi:hypothetical protein
MNEFKKQLHKKLTEVFELTPMGKYYENELIPSIEKYNRADTVNLDDNEKNDFRHIAGGIFGSKRYTPLGGLGLGILKEGMDFLRGTENDYWTDLKNNARGVKIYRTNPKMSDTEYFDLIFNNYTLPKRKNLFK